MSTRGMLQQPVVDKSSALDLIFGFLQIAQRRGAFSFPESAKIYECIQQFNDFFVHEKPPPEEMENNNSDLSDADLSTSPNTYREQRVVSKEREFRKRGKDFSHIYCGNCGNSGHTYRRCKFPITSCGVILYRINPKWKEETNEELQKKIDKFSYLLIQRKDTLGYVEFMRGKYDELNKDYIITLLETMTKGEVENIKKYSFDELWNMLWLNKNIKQYQTEYDISKRKFTNLLQNKYFIFEKLLEDADIIYEEKEWGFPKGRRNLRETDYNLKKEF